MKASQTWERVGSTPVKAFPQPGRCTLSANAAFAKLVFWPMLRVFPTIMKAI